ncbi:MAG: RnfABCDGE type electron transport complex subunit G [Candidatus Margulisiibacteriota bacterium]|jgi:electron transport complex protein RnfG
MKKNIKMAAVLALFCVISAGLLAYVYNVTQPLIVQNAKRSFDLSLKRLIPAESFKQEKNAFVATKGKEVVGYAFAVKPQGYGGPVEMLVGLDKEGRVLAVKVLSHKETAGLGSNIENQKFLQQFVGKTAQDKIEPKQDIDALTGATISTRAVCYGVREAIDQCWEIIK